MANHMKEVAQMLGVELNKEFEVHYGFTRTSTAKITNTGLHILDTNLLTFGEDLEKTTLEWLLCGLCYIAHKPWKPSCNEQYYSIGPGGVLEPGTWLNDFIDRALYKLGNCYCTPQAAEIDRDKWIAFYNSDEMLEV